MSRGSIRVRLPDGREFEADGEMLVPHGFWLASASIHETDRAVAVQAFREAAARRRGFTLEVD